MKAQRYIIPRLTGRFIAVKEGVLLKPDADVVFFAGEHPQVIAPALLSAFQGTHAVVRGKGHPVFPDYVRRVWRTTEHTRLSEDPTEVAGYDAGTSAMNLAVLFGATEIVMIGYDMVGHRWFNGERSHPQPLIPEDRHSAHLAPLAQLAEDARAKGLTIWNASLVSKATMFPYRPLESFL